MDDDAAVLPFTGGAHGEPCPRGRGAGSVDEGQPAPARPGRSAGRHWSDPYGADEDDYLSRDLRQVTEVVVIGDRVVDVVQRPVHGTGYECAALEIEDERRRPRQPPPPPEPPGHEKQLDWLARIVGGPDALAGLDTQPLPDEEGLDLAPVPVHLRERVVAIDEAVAPTTSVLLGDEARTAARRLLVRAVSGEPAVLTCSDRDDIAAGAVLWAVARGNDLAGPNRPLRASAVSAVFGLRSSPSQRGEAFVRAAGGGLSSLHPWPRIEPDVVPLGDPGLLLGRFRRRLLSLRDLALALRDVTPVV